MDITDNNDISHKRSENVSFRLNKDTLAKLKIDADQKQISLNTLANQVFDFYVNFTRLASAEMLPEPKVALTDLVEGYDEVQLKAHAERVYNKVGLDIIYQLRGKYGFETVLGVWDYRLTMVCNVPVGIRVFHVVRFYYIAYSFYYQKLILIIVEN